MKYSVLQGYFSDRNGYHQGRTHKHQQRDNNWNSGGGRYFGADCRRCGLFLRLKGGNIGAALQSCQVQAAR